MKTYLKSIINNYFPCILRPYHKSDNTFKKFLPYICLSFIIYLIGLWQFANYDFPQLIWSTLEKTFLLILSYYIMEELEPDMKQNYNIALIFTVIAIFFTISPNILGALVILFSARILSRSSGFKSSFPELIILLFLGLYLFFFSSYSYPLIISGVLATDLLKDPKNKKEILFLIPLASISIIGSLRSLSYLLFLQRITLPFAILFTLITMLFALRISLIKRIYTLNDLELKALSPRRIKALNTIILLGTFIESFAYGNGNEFLYIWAITLGLSLPYLKDIKKIIKI